MSGAQRFWNGVCWLKTPKTYNGLNYPDAVATHRCNLYCRFELEQAFRESDSHYTIAVVLAQDGETFRSNSRLYSQTTTISPTAYGVTTREMQDVMGRGSVRHDWHANPWQQAAEAFTGVKANDWKGFQHRIFPERL